MKLDQIAFINISSDPVEQHWLSSLQKMCFVQPTVSTYEQINDLILDSHDTNSIVCCGEKDLVLITSLLKECNAFFPILILSTNTSRSSKFKDQEHFTLEVVLKDMLSPGLFKLAITSLLRDYQKEQQLRALAHFDPLTGTANRHLFNDRLKQAIKQAKRNLTPLSVLYFDLDKFKPVNDTYGHHTGDELLKTFSRKVRHLLRDVDTLGRLGGDEFSAILTNTTLAQAEATAERIILSLAQIEDIDGHKLNILTSIGILTCGSPQKLKNLSLGQIMKEVDAITYKAKLEGNHSFASREL